MNAEPVPHSYEAERGLLGSILFQPFAIYEVAGEVSCLSFHKFEHRVIYSEFESMIAGGKPVDLVSFTNHLREVGQLEAAGGSAYVTEVFNSVPTAANLHGYKASVARLHKARVGIEAIENLRAMLYKETGADGVDAATILEDGAERIRQLTGNNGPLVRRLGDLQKPDGTEELLKHRALCRGGGALLVAPTGVGKSSLLMQCGIRWALGQHCFGIRPAKPLKIALMQAENDDGDLWEMRDGVLNGLHLSSDEQKRALNNITFRTEDSTTGERFCSRVVRPVLHYERPDLLMIDPALSYLGGDTKSQEIVGAFLRNELNPLLHRYGCGCIIAHHTNKPPSGKEKPDWNGGDFAYLGSGSAEWANWARMVIALRSIGRNDVYELRLGKRGSRIGWKEADGVTPAYSKLIGHSKEPGVICWHELDDDEAAEITTSGSRATAEQRQRQMLVAFTDPMTAGEFQKHCHDELGIGASTFWRHWETVKLSLRQDKRSGRWEKPAA